MKIITTYRGHNVTASDIIVIKEIIAAHSEGSRRFISQEVCRAWQWRQTNGALKDMVCRSLLLLLQKKDLIKLPPPKCKPANPLANRKKPDKIEVDRTPIECPIEELYPIHLKQVRKTRLEKLFNSLISEHHYLGYTPTLWGNISSTSLLGVNVLLPVWLGVQRHVYRLQGSIYWLVNRNTAKESSSPGVAMG